MRRFAETLTFFVVAAGLLSSVVSFAANPVKIDTVKTHLVIPRPALEPLKSLITSSTDPIDTLDTVNEHVKVVLFADNTWQYYKTPDFEALTGVLITIGMRLIPIHTRCLWMIFLSHGPYGW